jgi:hypothetical protein
MIWSSRSEYDDAGNVDDVVVDGDRRRGVPIEHRGDGKRVKLPAVVIEVAFALNLGGDLTQ